MITSLLEFFALGTVGFWILCSLISIIFIATIENEHYTFPTIVALLFGILYWKAFAALHWDWHGIALGVFIYAVAGVVWSIFRWMRFVKGTVEDYTKRYGEELSESSHSSLKCDISPTHNKSLIVGWIAYWPWSLVWNITGDFFKMIYETMQGFYSGISKKALAGVKIKQPEAASEKRQRLYQ